MYVSVCVYIYIYMEHVYVYDYIIIKPILQKKQNQQKIIIQKHSL